MDRPSVTPSGFRAAARIALAVAAALVAPPALSAGRPAAADDFFRSEELSPDVALCGKDWPFKCAKSRAIHRDACEYLARIQNPNGSFDGTIHVGYALNGLTWLAARDPKHWENARRLAYGYRKLFDPEACGTVNWGWSYMGVFLAEYYHWTWLMDLSRRWDGGFLLPESMIGHIYTYRGPVLATGGMAQVYAMPARVLRIHGAPKSVFAARDLPPELEGGIELYRRREFGELQRTVRPTSDLARQLPSAADLKEKDLELTFAGILLQPETDSRPPRQGNCCHAGTASLAQAGGGRSTGRCIERRVGKHLA